MSEMKLSDISEYVTERIELRSITLDQYVTTDSLLQNKQGRETATNLPPQRCKLTAFKKDDVLIANIRPYLKKIWKADCSGGCSNDVLVFRAKENHSPKFLYSLLCQDAFFDYVMVGTKGSKMPRGDKDQIMRYAFPSRPSEEEERVGTLIENIDRKIALNRAMNEKLEAMAKELYDYWFVQFDFPDAQGRPYKSSGGKMVWNEQLKREIPDGWEVKKISDLVTICRETVRPRNGENYCHYSIPSFDATGTYSLEKGDTIESDKFVLSSDQILVSKLNPKFNRVVWTDDAENMIGSTEFVAMSASPDDRGYLYSIFKKAPFINFCMRAATGTSQSQRRVVPDVLTSYPMPYDKRVVGKFSHYIEATVQKQRLNLNQIRMLEKQRDELLPLLMNRQVTLK